MVFLLDVNVLIALVDPAHVHHEMAHEWFADYGQLAWATCPMTENGVLRNLGHPRYPNSPGTPSEVLQILVGMCKLPGHTFWCETISLLNENLVDLNRLLRSGQVTDSYLLALACENKGTLATFDRRLVVDAVFGGAACLHVIG